jgi:hypothetical protein
MELIVLFLASRKTVSAARLKRVVRSACFVEVRRTKKVFEV